MVNLQNDGTKNAHIMKSASMRWYGSMEKNAKYNKTAVEKFKRKPYQIAGGNKNGNDKKRGESVPHRVSIRELLRCE